MNLNIHQRYVKKKKRRNALLRIVVKYVRTINNNNNNSRADAPKIAYAEIKCTLRSFFRRFIFNRNNDFAVPHAYYWNARNFPCIMHELSKLLREALRAAFMNYETACIRNTAAANRRYMGPVSRPEGEYIRSIPPGPRY